MAISGSISVSPATVVAMTIPLCRSNSRGKLAQASSAAAIASRSLREKRSTSAIAGREATRATCPEKPGKRYASGARQLLPASNPASSAALPGP